MPSTSSIGSLPKSDASGDTRPADLPAIVSTDTPGPMMIEGQPGLGSQESKPVDLAPIHKRDFGFLPIPKWRRYDPAMTPVECFPWTWRLNAIFAMSATVAVMNLYYVQPMLVAIAASFDVSNDNVSRISTLVQGGYGVGILFISPLGDLVRRRALVLALMAASSCLTIGLARASSVAMLEGLSFVVGFASVTPQIMIPWTADMAPADKRARAMSTTLSGLIFGLVLGRVLGGVIADKASWRDAYWMALALQGTMLVIMYFCLPDLPDKKIGLSYFQVLLSMGKFMTEYPTLVQACCIWFFNSAVFAGFWTSLTFLLSDAPYHYSSLTIGLLGLLGIIGALLAPQWGRFVDRVVPWLAQLLGICTCLVAMVVALAAADRSVGAVCVAIILYDMGQQLLQVGSSYRIAGLNPKARARLNGCSLVCLFAGQTSGTAIMTKIYNTYGWRPTGACAVSFVCVSLLILLSRGPHETGWVGWHGGSQLLKREKMVDLSPEAITERQRGDRPAEKPAMPVSDEAIAMETPAVKDDWSRQV